jgi:hypothetical protein
MVGLTLLKREIKGKSQNRLSRATASFAHGAVTPGRRQTDVPAALKIF